MFANIHLGTILISVLAVIVLSLVGSQIIARVSKRSEKEKYTKFLQQAEEESKRIKYEAKEQALKIKEESEKENTRKRGELAREDDRLQKRRDDLDKRIERLEQREFQVNRRQSSVDKRSNEVEQLYDDQMQKLQQISQMTVDEAREVLLNEVEKEAKSDMVRIIRQIESEARQEGEKRARGIITDAIQRVASDQVVQVTTSTVSLPNDEMKGRI
ncbi:MAG: DUF3552 domain-containing protein, partial [Candidatus Marinimicrobia bacterium]|nr:DUF3552 domain-containing protein [Candidatus Neomarinimicrobiota bacterium]